MKCGDIVDNVGLRRVTRILLNIYRCLDAIHASQFSAYGLTRGQHSFLTRIVENPSINQEELSVMLKVDRSTTAKAIAKLIQKGLIQKSRRKNNNKEWILSPTEDGLLLNKKLDPLVHHTHRTLYAGITEQEVRQLETTLGKMEQNILREWTSLKNNCS